jgi:hypothetical protein
MSKFSPGPWAWYTDPDGEGSLPELVAPENISVCWFGVNAQYYPVEGRPPNEANARLIAAAPEMYELLQYATVPYDQQGRLIALLARIDGED